MEFKSIADRQSSFGWAALLFDGDDPVELEKIIGQNGPVTDGWGNPMSAEWTKGELSKVRQWRDAARQFAFDYVGTGLPHASAWAHAMAQVRTCGDVHASCHADLVGKIVVALFLGGKA